MKQFIAAKYDKQNVSQFQQEINDHIAKCGNLTNYNTIRSCPVLFTILSSGVMSVQGQGQSTKTDGQTTGTRVRGVTSQRKGESDLICATVGRD